MTLAITSRPVPSTADTARKGAPMVIAVALSLVVSVPTAVVIVSGELGRVGLVGLAAGVPVALGVVCVLGTAVADRSGARR